MYIWWLKFAFAEPLSFFPRNVAWLKNKVILCHLRYRINPKSYTYLMRLPHFTGSSFCNRIHLTNHIYNIVVMGYSDEILFLRNVDLPVNHV